LIYKKGLCLFVDEFQDVDPTQLKVFDRVIANKKFFIGDPDQAIYIFRGATSEVFKELEDFKDYKLDINYRSYQPILDIASCFKTQVKEDWFINLAHKMIEIFKFGSEDQSGF
jgi:ATP-dependent exoDNAse (exonuclease V) beta subunit